MNEAHYPAINEAYIRTRADSAIRYVPNGEVLDAVGKLMNDDGKTALAARGLLLSSRIMHFRNRLDIQQFNADTIKPAIDTSGSPLNRVDLTPGNTWEKVRSQHGEAYRVYLQPILPDALALESLYEAYKRYHGSIPPLGSDPLAQSKNQSLSFNLPLHVAEVSLEDGPQTLTTYLEERLERGGLLYARAAGTKDQITTI